MRGRTRLECHTVPCTQSWCGDGGPRVSSLEERGLACSVDRPIFESEMALRADLGL